MASCIATVSVGSTWKMSAMHVWATSIDSASSEVRVPSFIDVERKSMIARASRFLDSEVDDWVKGRRLEGREKLRSGMWDIPWWLWGYGY